MPVYTYKAKTNPNTFRSGTIEAESERAAVNKLLLLNYHPVSIKPQAGTNLRRLHLFNKIGSKEVSVFLRQLSNLNFAGLSIVKSLNNIYGQTSNQRLRPVLLDIKEKIQRGKTFSEALSLHTDVFSSLEINMIKSAETTGTLPEVLAKIADLKEKDIAFSYKIRSALAYPVLLISVGFLTLFVLTTFVLPKFITLFEDLDQELPLITLILINTSLFLRDYWVMIIGGIGALTFFFLRYIKTTPGRLWFDRLTLRIPLLRDTIVKIQTARFARTLGSLIENGVPVINSIKIVSEIATNMVFAQEIRHVHAQVAKGQHISEALKSSDIFEKNTLDLMAVGEESGRLDEMLLRIAQMNERESSQQIEVLMLMLEPALILILGVFIAIIVMAILLPIFQMNFLIQ